jgi:hypothetical protein
MSNNEDVNQETPARAEEMWKQWYNALTWATIYCHNTLVILSLQGEYLLSLC